MVAAPSPDAGRERQLDLLQVVCCVAWADDSVDDKERVLLERIVDQLAGEESQRDEARQLASWRQKPELMDEAIPRIRANGDGALAVKLAQMMAMASQGPSDEQLISPGERAAYRRLVDGLELDATTVEEAEWAARQELASGRSFWRLLGDAMASFGAWPAPEVLDNPAMQWL